MIEPIHIKGTEDIPTVTLDAGNEVFEITGKSLPEDVYTFYDPVLKWLEEYSKKPNKRTVFSFKLFYFNTASSRTIVDILTILEKIYKSGNDVVIEWHYPDDDEDIKDSGEDFMNIVDLPFEYISYSDI